MATQNPVPANAPVRQHYRLATGGGLAPAPQGPKTPA